MVIDAFKNKLFQKCNLKSDWQLRGEKTCLQYFAHTTYSMEILPTLIQIHVASPLVFSGGQGEFNKQLKTNQRYLKRPSEKHKQFRPATSEIFKFRQKPYYL